MQPQSIKEQRRKSECDDRRKPEPPCAPPGRKNHDPHFCARLCPTAARCPGFHVENIIARCNQRITREAMAALDFVPSVFELLEPVSIADALRVCITLGREFERERVLVMRQCDRPSDGNRFL